MQGLGIFDAAFRIASGMQRWMLSIVIYRVCGRSVHWLMVQRAAYEGLTARVCLVNVMYMEIQWNVQQRSESVLGSDVCQFPTRYAQELI